MKVDCLFWFGLGFFFVRGEGESGGRGRGSWFL